MSLPNAMWVDTDSIVPQGPIQNYCWNGLCRLGWHTKPQALHPVMGAHACILSEKLRKLFTGKSDLVTYLW